MCACGTDLEQRFHLLPGFSVLEPTRSAEGRGQLPRGDAVRLLQLLPPGLAGGHSGAQHPRQEHHLHPQKGYA